MPSTEEEAGAVRTAPEYSRCASAASAMTPPSPSLSARISTPTYFIETMRVIDQNISEMTP